MQFLGIEPPIDDPRAYEAEPPEPWWADPVQLAAADRKTLNKVAAIEPYGLLIHQPRYLNPEDIEALGQEWYALPVLASLRNTHAITSQADDMVIAYFGVSISEDLDVRLDAEEYIPQMWLNLDSREACILYPVVEARGETLAYEECCLDLKFSDALKIFEYAGYDIEDFVD